MINEEQTNAEETLETSGTTEPTVSQWKAVPENEPGTYNGEKLTILGEDNTEDAVVTPPSTSTEEVVTPPTTEEAIVTPEVATPPTATDIDDNRVLEYLKEKGFTASTLDELKPKEAVKLDPEVEKYLEYKKETGRSYSDFLELQRDWNEVDKGEILMMNLKNQNPTLNQKQLEFLFNKEYSFDADLDDDNEITMKEINIERDYQRGLTALNTQKEQYKTVRGSDDSSIPEEYRNAKTAMDTMLAQQEEGKKNYESTIQDFQAKTNDVFGSNFEGFEVKVGNESFKVKPEDVQATKNTLSDLNNFNTKFFDQQGKLTDPQGYYKALHFAMNPDKVAEHFMNLGKAMRAEEEERESKNIKVTGPSNVQAGLGTGKAWKVVG
jgi:hypothetical protein